LPTPPISRIELVSLIVLDHGKAFLDYHDVEVDVEIGSVVNVCPVDNADQAAVLIPAGLVVDIQEDLKDFPLVV
jgi:hypothetical protein